MALPGRNARPLQSLLATGLGLLLAGSAQGAPPPPAQAPPRAPASALAQPPPPLATRLQALIAAPRFDAATWGVLVQSLDSGRTLFAHNANKFFTPASNAKLFTAALALRQPGPGFRIRTSLYGASAPDALGVLHGDLILFGRGDPSILAKGKGGADPLEALADQAWAAGLRQVEGDLLGDDSFFAMPGYGSGWEAGDLAFAFGAAPSALTVHGNTVDLRVYPATTPGQPCLLFPMPGMGLLTLLNQTRTGPGNQPIRAQRALGDGAIRVTGDLAPGAAPVPLTVTVADPALLFAQLLGRALERRGIQVRGRARAVHFQQRPVPLATSQLVELGHLQSPSLASILRDTLKDSNNLSAQLLLLQAGAAAPGPGPNTESRALAALDTLLVQAGIPPGQVLLEEGSGLSRKDLVTPEALVALLAHLDRSPEAALFRDALPQAGLDGTLRSRMDGTAAQGRVQAKTGTLRYTHSLVGYATTTSGERLAFALLLNNYRRDPKDPSAQADLDALAVALAEN